MHSIILNACPTLALPLAALDLDKKDLAKRLMFLLSQSGNDFNSHQIADVEAVRYGIVRPAKVPS